MLRIASLKQSPSFFFFHVTQHITGELCLLCLNISLWLHRGIPDWDIVVSVDWKHCTAQITPLTSLLTRLWWVLSARVTSLHADRRCRGLVQSKVKKKNLSLHMKKTKHGIVDFTRASPFNIDGCSGAPNSTWQRNSWSFSTTTIHRKAGIIDSILSSWFWARKCRTWDKKELCSGEWQQFNKILGVSLCCFTEIYYIYD